MELYHLSWHPLKAVNELDEPVAVDVDAVGADHADAVPASLVAHPMIRRTIVDGVSAADIPEIQTA